MRPDARRGPGKGLVKDLHGEADSSHTTPDEIESPAPAGGAVMTSGSLASWAVRIRPHLMGAAEHIIAAGNELLAAKAELPHGSFGPLLEELGLSRQMANRFMRVANNTAIANRSHVGGLPAAVSVLDVLARLDNDQLERALDDGRVTQSTTRAEAEVMVGRLAIASMATRAVQAVDDLCNASVAPIQERDHVRDLAEIVAIAEVRSLGGRVLSGESEPIGSLLAQAWPEVVALDDWMVAMFVIGTEALFVDSPPLDIDRPFGPQLTERMANAENLSEAMVRWFTTDKRAEVTR